MKSGRTDEWTEAQTDALLRIWNKGKLSASEIAQKHGSKIGHRSRNAILGRLGRLHRLKSANKPKSYIPGGRPAFKGKTLTPEECFMPGGVDDALDDLARAD